jgi:hypothetical protein
MPVIPANRVVDKKRIIGKNGGPRGEEGKSQGVADPPIPTPTHPKKSSALSYFLADMAHWSSRLPSERNYGFNGKIYELILTENELGKILADFFTNSFCRLV